MIEAHNSCPFQFFLHRLIDLLAIQNESENSNGQEEVTANGCSDGAADDETNHVQESKPPTEENDLDGKWINNIEDVAPESFLAMWSAFTRLVYFRIERAKELEKCIHRLLALPSLLGKSEAADGKG